MLQVVSSILRVYHNDHAIDVSNEFPVRTALLHPYVEQRGVVDKINLFQANITTTLIVAKVQKFRGESSPYSGIQDIANIYYAGNFNVCWRRFGVCKEMFHCMIDRSEADRVATLESLQTLLELLAADTTALTGDFPPLDREQQAELLALETLFPVEFRLKYLDDPVKSKDEYLKISKNFRIPIEYAILACQPNYVKMCRQLRGRLLELT